MIASYSNLPRCLVALSAIGLVVWCAIEPAEATPAAQVYAQKCASCHGADGGGVADVYDQPLAGDLSIEALAERIAETMPEDDPESCVGDEALAVARFIHGEFYSLAARREKGLLDAPRVELARLTEMQYRNAVADLVAALTSPSKDTDGEGGLLGEYYQSDGMNKTSDRRLRRVDRQIDFDFADGKPADSINAEQFAIIWQGSVLARHTGHYEFRVRTPNGARLYVNEGQSRRQGKLRDDDSQTMQARLIDAWVSSGKMQEHSGRVYLLGGRTYSLRLEFFKYLEPTASIRLEWKPPHGVWEVPDERVLSSGGSPRTYVVDAPFPADDRSAGYERGSSVSPEWHAATVQAALATAEEVASRLPELAGVGELNDEARPKLADFVARLASLAYRRPLTPEEDVLFRQGLFDESPPEVAVGRAVVLVLTSPHFLYTDLTPADAAPTQHARAARLAFALWDSLPDEPLRRAADEGQLATADQLLAHAERMLDDPRARLKMQGFFEHWLELEERDLAKDAQMFPEFDQRVIADLRRSLELFVDEVLWSEHSDYRQLLAADYLLLNERLKELYGAPSGDEAPASEADPHFVRVAQQPGQRSGVLTHPYLLSAFAYHNNTSPIHRGVFLTRNIVGRQLKPPPVAVAFESAEFPPELTMREKVTQLTRDQACMACHSVINPLGFALENYDAIGRWRTTENDKPIDPRGEYVTVEGTSHPIAGARDVANFTLALESAQQAFVRQLFQHLVHQNPAAYGPGTLDDLSRDFAADAFHVQRLMARIATRAAAYNPVVPTSLEKSP